MKFMVFFKKGFFLFFIFAIFLTILMITNLVNNDINAAWIGLILGFLNFIAGIAALSSGISRPDNQFFIIFFGGMILRFTLIFISLFLLIKLLDIHKVLLISSLLFSYVSFMILEIWQVRQSSISRGKGE